MIINATIRRWNFKKYGEKCGHCKTDMLLPYDYEITCFSGGYNVRKQKHQHKQSQWKKINFIDRLKYAEQKMICICIDVYKVYEGDDYDKIYEVLSTLKNKKWKTNNILIEKNKDIIENPDFEQDYWSRTAIRSYKRGHDSIRSMKWLAFYDRSFFENINCFDMMGSIVKIKETWNQIS